MNRLTDLLVSFSVALLLHGVLVLGAVWFWTMRSPELRPIFQSGDSSLAVMFIAPPPSPKRYGGQALEDIVSRKSGTTDIWTDPETEMTEDGRQRTDSAAESPPEEGEDQDILDTETAAPVSAQASANAPDDGRQTPEDGLPTVAPGAKAGRQTDSATELPSDALRQGVSGAVRVQSEIRPYYPLGARLRGEEGVVTVRVWVNPSGRARRCEVARSSGYPALDEAAVDAARRARYVSTRLGAWRAEVETALTFQFRLTE